VEGETLSLMITVNTPLSYSEGLEFESWPSLSYPCDTHESEQHKSKDKRA
jgi:hypothetical protein